MTDVSWFTFEVNGRIDLGKISHVHFLPHPSELITHESIYVFIRHGDSRDNSVGTATSYGLDDRMIGVRFPAGVGNFSFRHHVQTGSGAHPAFYSMDTEIFPWR
jgi:hypothetical protein